MTRSRERAGDAAGWTTSVRSRAGPGRVDGKCACCTWHARAWLLLHFQAFSGAQSGSSKNVVDKLRQAADAFRDYDKRGDKSIRGSRRDALKGLEHKAVARARHLIASCPHGKCAPARTEPERADRGGEPLPSDQWAARSGHAPDCPILRRDPSTDVWRLLVALGIV